MFVRSRTVYEQILARTSAVPSWDGVTAPTVFGLPAFTTPTFVADESSGISVSVTITDGWAEQSTAVMSIFQGKTCSLARNYFKGPWRMIGGIEGDVGGVTNPTVFNAATILAKGYPMPNGNCCNLSVSVLDTAGRLSNRRRCIPQTIVP
jgi:hypothetical protein